MIYHGPDCHASRAQRRLQVLAVGLELPVRSALGRIRHWRAADLRTSMDYSGCDRAALGMNVHVATNSQPVLAG
jgi:hypothetical protein